LTCELITQLALLDPARLGVIARTTVIPYKQPCGDIKQIGRRLNLDYVLEGSVRLAGRQMRIAARLITTRRKCSRKRGDPRSGDALSIQIAFAQRVAVMVRKRLVPVD
jgi:adenylate cyclase